MRILIATGGTGGHLYPGIALAQELKKSGDYRMGKEVFLVIRKNERRKNILQAKGIPFFELNFQGLPRKISLNLLFFFPKLFWSIKRSLKIIKDLQPDLILGMGGYLSFPVILAGKICSIPIIIHEQNLYPGLANRLLTPLVDKIALSFPESSKFFPRYIPFWCIPPEKTVYTGNPIRDDLRNITKEEARKKFGFSLDKFTVLIFGGSAGARKINEVVVNSLPLLSSFRMNLQDESLKEKIQFFHLTGEKDFSWVEEKYRQANFPAKVLPYLEEMGFAYACADLVISRAGASTIAEILTLKKPAILIPYPYATGRHQELQARYLSEKGCAYFLLNEDFSPAVFIQYIKDFLTHPEKLKKISTSIENLNLPQATKELVNLILHFLEASYR